MLSKHKKLNGSVCSQCINVRHSPVTKCLALLDLPTKCPTLLAYSLYNLKVDLPTVGSWVTFKGIFKGAFKDFVNVLCPNIMHKALHNCRYINIYILIYTYILMMIFFSFPISIIAQSVANISCAQSNPSQIDSC